MKRFFKWLGAILLISIFAVAIFATHQWFTDKPINLRVYLDRETLKMALDSPETLTSLGFLESVGITKHNALLDDNSPEKGDELFAQLKQVRQGILQYQDQDLDKNELMSKQIALYLLDFLVENEQYRYHNYPVNQLFGIQNNYPSFMQAQHQVNSTRDAMHYIARLEAVNLQFQQTIAGLKIRQQQQIIPPAFVIDRVIDEMQKFIETPIAENILYSSLEQKLTDIESFPADEKQQILQQAETAISQSVYPAYQQLIDYFIQIRPLAGNNDGMWHMPDGDKVYASSLAFFTTTDMTADEIHQLGLSEIERIQAEMLAILALEGYDTSQGFNAAMEQLKADPSQYYPDTDAGRAQILADYQTILDEIGAGLDHAFRVRPEAGMEVVRIPEFKEKTSPGAYYQQPAIDGSRPGRFFANLYDIKATPKYSMRTLAYHEAYPAITFKLRFRWN